MTGRKSQDEEAAAQRRAAPRASVCGNARLREVGRTPFKVALSDLSSTGFRMVTFARLEVDAKIWISLPGLAPLEAIVRRRLGQDYGCEFLLPLHPAVTAHLQAQLR